MNEKKMTRYIDTTLLKAEFTGNFIDTYSPALIKAIIDGQPTADAVEVVRCKDCVVPHNQWTGCPKLNGLVTPPDFYCNYGERRLKK